MMAGTTGRKAPLPSRGQVFYDQVMAAFTFSGPELELLAEIRDVLDEISGLKAAVQRDGLTVSGAAGQVRVHPGVAQLTQHRIALGRLLSQLGIPDEEGVALASPLSARARKAARARWAKDPYHQAAGA